MDSENSGLNVNICQQAPRGRPSVKITEENRNGGAWPVEKC